MSSVTLKALRPKLLAGAVAVVALVLAVVLGVTGTSWARTTITIDADWLDVYTDDNGETQLLYADTSWYYDAEEGTTEYEIDSAAELAGLAYLVDERLAFNSSDYDDCTVTLTKDIDISGVEESGSEDGLVWMPIGFRLTNTEFAQYYDAFRGTFDGNGHTVSGMHVKTNAYSYEGSSDYYNGLFGYTWYATIEDLTVEGSAAHSYGVGGIVGYANYSSIVDCASGVDVTYNDSYTTARAVGGIVGYSYGSTVEDCETLEGANVEVCSAAYAGGIVGETAQSSTVSGCVNHATFSFGDGGKSSSSFYIGGIAGYTYGTNYVLDCVNEADIDFASPVSAASVGGIVGYFQNAAIDGCVNNGDLSPKKSYAGGIVGRTYVSTSGSSYNSTWEILNCRNTGDITSGTYRSGIVSFAYGSSESYYEKGSCPEIKWCYSTGSCTYGIGRLSTTNKYKYYDIDQVYVLDGTYSTGLLYDEDGLESTPDANSVDSDGLKAAGVSLSQESESWSMNLTGYVDSSAEVEGGYPILDWETEATVEYRNIDGTIVLMRAAFDADASLDADAVEAVYESCDVELLPTASGSVEEGHELDLSNLAWVTEVNGTNSTTHAAGASDVTYATGIWDEETGDYTTTLAEYTVDYVGLTGATTSNPTSYTVESDDIVLSDPEGGSGTFLGWADVTEAGKEVEDVSGCELVEEIPSGSTGDLVLQAVWSDSDTVYAVTYNDPEGEVRTALVASGCTYTAGSDDAVTVTSDCTVADPEDEPDEGYENVGWVASYDSDGNLVLTVVSGTPIEYQIVYELNGGEYLFDENPATATVEDDVKLISPSREDLDFWGWQVDDSDGDYVTRIDADTLLNYAVQGEDGTWTLTLFAAWPVYDIVYHGLDDGYAFNSLSNPDTYSAGEEVQLYDAEKYGYTFTGWYDNEELDGEPQTYISSSSRGTVELWAGWEIVTYTVTVDLNDDDSYGISATSPYDGGLSDGSDGFTYDATCDDIVLEDAERTGFDFGGWKDEDGSTVYMIFGQGLTHEDMDLTASWTLKTYTVTYMLNGGTVSGGTSGWLSSYNVTTSKVSLSDYPEPTRDGYEFAGWYLYETDEDGNVTLGDTQVTSIAGGETGDLVLGAKWEGIEYSITYNLNGGSWGDADPADSYYTEDGAELLEPVRDGYDFAGWYDNANLEGDALTSIEAGTTGDLTLYASWTEQEDEEEEAIEVQAPSTGVVEVEAPDEFADAEVVDLTTSLDDGGEYETSAVVAEGTIEFYAEESGSYEVTQSSYPTTYGYDGYDGMDVWSNMDMLTTTRAVSNLEHTLGRQVTSPIISTTNEEGGLSLYNGSNNMSDGKAYFVPYKGVDKEDADALSYGSEDDPIASLVHFVGVGEDPTGALELTRPAQDGLLGYISTGDAAYLSAGNVEDGESPLDQETDYEPTYFVAEDRDEDTGRLLASVLFEPSEESSPSNYAEGGQNSFSLVLDPTEDMLLDRLSAHSDYADGTYDAETDASEIAAAEVDDGVMVLANLDSMVAYTTGGKIYTLDIATLSDGEFEAGDTVELAFLAASGDDDAYPNDPPEMYEEKLQATDVELTVDSDGYIEFTLYGGGVYTLADDDEESAAAVEELADSITWVTEDSSDSSLSDDSSNASGSTDIDESSSSDSESGSSSGSSAKTKTRTKTIVKTIIKTVTKRVPIVVSSGSSSSSDDSTASGGISLDVDSDDDEDSGAKSIDDEEIGTTEGTALDEGEGSGDGDEAGNGNAEYNKFFQDGDGNIIWWRIILLFILIFLILAILFFLLGWLLHRRKKQKEEDEEEDAAAAAAMAAGSPASSGLGSAATHAAMSSEAATQVAVEAARKAAEEAAKK